MANFSDMRNLVELVQSLNDEKVRIAQENKNIDISKDNIYYSLLITKEEAIKEFSKTINGDVHKARKVYGDATSGNYMYIRDKNGRADVLSSGRGLIKKRLGGRIPTGICREMIEKGSKAITIIGAILICIATIINVLIAIF